MNQLDFSGRTAVVTGGAAGIGLATAQRLAASGATVVLWDRDAAAKGTVAPDRPLDVADADSVARAAAATAQALDRIDIRVRRHRPQRDDMRYPVDAWRQMIDVNLKFFYCNRAVITLMLKNDGRIVSIASVAGKPSTRRPTARRRRP
jgi:3-oxoacyl-[acyl-carrier protein] reductase